MFMIIIIKYAFVINKKKKQLLIYKKNVYGQFFASKPFTILEKTNLFIQKLSYKNSNYLSYMYTYDSNFCFKYFYLQKKKCN